MISAILERMSDADHQIVRCPSELRGEALALVLCEIAPSQRREMAGGLLDGGVASVASAGGLYVALRDGATRGAAWGQRQPGNSAVFWPPRLVAGENSSLAIRLSAAVICHLDEETVGMSQALVPPEDSELPPILGAAGFAYLADLLYLSCEAGLFPVEPAPSGELQFVGYDPAERGRMMDVVERTYEATLDCADLNGKRRMEDVLEGYVQTGVFRRENWLIAVHQGCDVGVLLMADHPPARHWELMYMGLVSEARGRGWGREIVRHAQELARRAGVERIVLAVDAANCPALAMYERAGFVVWDRRRVYVRTLGGNG